MEVLPDSEYAVLGLLRESGPVSGYRLHAIITERGMVHWAGLSATSLYKSLRNLRRRRYVSATRDSNKSGKGPAGFAFCITGTGTAALRQHVRESLLSAREHSASFKLGLALIESIPRRDAAELLRRRITSLRARRSRAVAQERSLRAQGVQPLAACLLFQYVDAALESEIRVLKSLIRILQVRGVPV